MPFMGKDWRSPGEAWVKTESLGWQRMKLIESQLSPTSGFCHQGTACSWPPQSDYGQHMVHHCNNAHLTTTTALDSTSRDATSSPGSSDSGRGDSVSPSPSSSPEKSTAAHQHLFPLAFSSPYGSYAIIQNCNHQTVGSSPMNENRIQANRLVAHCDSISGKIIAQSNDQLDSDQLASNIKFNALVDNNCDNRRRLSITLGNNEKRKESFNNLSGHLLGSDGKRNLSILKEPSALKENDNLETSYCDQCSTSNSLVQKQAFDSQAKNQCGYYNNIGNYNDQASTTSKLETPPINVDHKATVDLQKQNTASLNNTSCNIIHNPSSAPKIAPFCPISIRTREVAIYNTISEAFYRLDFCNAVHDIRRFNYVCKLLHLLITQNLTSLGGCATKVLFNMLEQIAREVSTNKCNIHVLKNLLNELKLMINKYSCWGRPIGSRQLWQQHSDTIERISRMVDNIELAPTQTPNQRISFNELPVEMIREIILRLNDHRDLISSARASPVMKAMIVSQNIWERLCRYHFTEQQVKCVLDGYKRTPLDRRPKNYYVRTNSAELRKQQSKNKTRSSKSDRLANTTSNEYRDDDCKSRSSASTSFTASKSSQSNNRLKDTSSIVNRTKKIFDAKHQQQTPQQVSSKSSTSASSSTSISQKSNRSTTTTDNSSKRFKHSNRSNDSFDQNNPTSTTTTTTNETISIRNINNRPQQELDWEDVFHQLRKRYDLKEEYADCLLLCRHCRCLFWKSIGHPCIQGDESCLYQLNRTEPDINNRPTDQSGSQSSNLNNNNNPSNREQIPPSSSVLDRRGSNGHQAQVGGPLSSHRVSVAALSRNFDNRSRASGSQDRRLQPNANVLGNIQLNNNQLNNRQNVLESNNNVRNNSNHVTRQCKRNIDDLVPKHVAISPQAFLKFFSL